MCKKEKRRCVGIDAEYAWKEPMEGFGQGWSRRKDFMQQAKASQNDQANAGTREVCPSAGTASHIMLQHTLKR